jgi:hypothetical protein
MAPSTIRIEQEGLEEAIASLVLLEDPIDMTELANTLALLTQADVDERFNSSPGVRTGGAVFGGVTWEPLTDRYLEANPRREGGQLLRDTGELLNSFQVGDAFNVLESDASSVTFGSALPKARGLSEKRPMLFVHDQLADSALEAIALFISERA